MREVVGGVPISISNSLVSLSMLTLTGTFIPAKSALLLLISSTTCIMLIPKGPNAGPNGGPGVALPPSIRISTVSLAISQPPFE